jgi:hypothetical protein
MSSPVITDDVVAGAVKYLQTFPDLTELVGSYQGEPWIFQHELAARPEGRSSTAVVVSYAGGWSPPSPHHTTRFPRLSIEYWCDPIRNADRTVRDPSEVRRRVQAVYEAFDHQLHWTRGDPRCWGSLRVLSSVRLGELSAIYPVPDGDGMVRGQVFYGVVVG